jgi:hypothetical protein
VEVLIFLIVLSALIGYWASAWGRSGWAWGIVAFIFSPIIVSIILLIVGKSLQKKAEEAKYISDCINK